jgi:hypothetical protein
MYLQEPAAIGGIRMEDPDLDFGAGSQWAVEHFRYIDEAVKGLPLFSFKPHIFGIIAIHLDNARAGRLSRVFSFRAAVVHVAHFRPRS